MSVAVAPPPTSATASRHPLHADCARRHPAGRLIASDLRSFGGVIAAGIALWPLVPAVGLVCPLRQATGVPCPFCGMTTSALATAHGDIAAAFAANPFGPVLIATIVAAFIVPLVTRRELPLRARPVSIALVGLLPLLWLFELHRFAII